jgi:hypothetical protein
MKRRILLALVAVAVVLGVMALASQKPRQLLVLEWAHKAPAEEPLVAVLIEMGVNDSKLAKGNDWSGSATVMGARPVRREGYRFRPSEGDKLLDGGAWEASSHRGLRVPPKQPAVAKMEPIATVGVVLYLTDLTPDAAIVIELKNKEFPKKTVALKDVLAGKAQTLWDGAAVVRLVSTAFAITGGQTEDDFPAAAYGPDGTLWVAYVSYTVRHNDRRIEQNQFKEQPGDFNALYMPEYADQVWVKSYRGNQWSEPIAVTGPKESIARCAIAVEGNGTVWAIYSAHRNGKQTVLARALDSKGPKDVQPKFSKEIAFGGSNAMSPSACTDQNGDVHVAWQARDNRGGERQIGQQYCKGSQWRSGENYLYGTSLWCPCVVAGLQGDAFLAYDSYTGDYDVRVSRCMGGGDDFLVLKSVAALESARFEARPSIAVDPKGRLWIAYEEGPEKWGKDYGSLGIKDGNPLYTDRSVRVVCVDTDGTLKRPVADLPTSTAKAPVMAGDAQKTHAFERSTKYAYPKIGIDGKGRVWLTYRQNFGSRYSSHPGGYWVTFARRLDGDTWSEPIEIHHSDGLLDSRPVLLPHNTGGLLVIHNSDGRMTTPEVIQNQVYKSVINLTGDPVEPKLVPFKQDKRTAQHLAAYKKEKDAVATMKNYRLQAAGKKYQLLRGEYHRHTEISWDGSPDGSLEDMFRYAIDAVAFDWIGNGDHDNGAGREYAWWLVQKFTDAYHVPDHFTTMFTYERSVAYPHGHRNCMFAKRGVMTLPRLAPPAGVKAEGGVHADDTKMLYRYLKEMDGICAVHTSATSMGTDWRDNDPVVEPIVEIYQGDRMSYEHEGAPRAGYEAKSGKQPVNVAGWFPKGFINHALQQGYKLGFQASSDHWSTHISFFVILSEKRDRQSLLEAVKKRHCYGATDNIVVDFRSGDHIMGDEFKSATPPQLQMNVIGTNKIAKIDVLRDSEVVDTIKPGTEIYTGTWTDPNPQPGMHYYYIRVVQTDQEIAWASPMWIDWAK